MPEPGLEFYLWSGKSTEPPGYMNNGSGTGLQVKSLHYAFPRRQNPADRLREGRWTLSAIWSNLAAVATVAQHTDIGLAVRRSFAGHGVSL